MDLTPSALFANLLVSAVGVGFFLYVAIPPNLRAARGSCGTPSARAPRPPLSVGGLRPRRGKKQQRLLQLVTGLAMSVHPYFVDGAALLLGIATALLAALWFCVRQGF